MTITAEDALPATRNLARRTALLAGDGLLTLAFWTIAQAPAQTGADTARCLRACFELAQKAGMDGMIGGQIWILQTNAKR